MSTASYELDISKFLQQSKQIEAAFKAQATALENTIKSTIRYNDAGEETSGVVRIVISELEEASVAYRKTEKGLEVLGTTVNKTAQGMRKLREEAQKIASLDNLKQLNKSTRFSKAFDIDEVGKFEKIKTRIRELNSEQVNPKIIKDFMDQLRDGKTVEATGQLAKLRDELKKIVELENIVEARTRNRDRARKAVPRFDQFAQKELLPAAFKLQDIDLKPAQMARVRKSLESLRDSIKIDPDINTTKIRAVMDQLKTNPIKIFDDPVDQKIADRLSTILNIYRNIINAKRQDQQLDQNKLGLMNKQSQQIDQDSKQADLVTKLLRRRQLQPTVDQFKANGATIDTGRLDTQLKGITQLGVRAGLNSKQLGELFDKVKNQDVASVEAKYIRIIQRIVTFNRTLESEINKTAKLPPMKLPIADEAGFGRLNGLLSILDRVKTTLQFFVIYKGFSIISDSLKEAVKDARDYEIQVSLIRTISQEAQLSSKEWASGLAGVSSKLGIEFKDVAAGAYDAISNQVTQGRQTFKFVEDAGNLARTTNSTLKDSVNLLSSVVNVYGTRAGTVEEISAKLFKTIDRGRIVASDLSNTFGRVAFTAEDVGVSTNELLGTLALLTRSGVTTDDAMTLVNNVMVQVLKPSESLKKVFEDLGIGSARNAIKIKGFAGTLELLQKAIEEGKVNVEDIFPEMRANKGFSFLRGRLSELKNEIKIIGQESGQTYKNALEIRDEPVADKIAKISMTIKNALATTVGQGVNEAIVSFAENITGLNIKDITKDQESFAKATERLNSAIRTTVKSVIAVAGGLGVARVAFLALTVAQEISIARAQRGALVDEVWTKMKLTNAAATRAQAVAEVNLANKRNGVAGSGSLAKNIAGGLLIGAAVSYILFKNTAVESISEISQAHDELIKKYNTPIKINVVANQAEKLTEVFAKAGQGITQQIATKLTEVNDKLFTAKRASSEMGEVLRNGFVAYLDLAKNKIQDLERAATQLQTRLDNKNKSSGKYSEKTDETIFGLQQQYAADPQFIQVTQNKINQLREKAKELFAKTDETSVEEANHIYDRIVEMASQIEQRQMQMRVKETEANGGGVVLFDQANLSRTLNVYASEKLALEKQLNIELQKQKDKIDQQVAAEKMRQDALQKSMSKFEKFDIMNADNSIRPEFRTKTGQVDMGAVTQEFNKLTDDIMKNVDKDVMKNMGFDFMKMIGDRRKTIRDEINATNEKNDLTTKQSETIKTVDDTTAALEKQQKAAKENREAMNQYLDDAITKGKVLIQTMEKLPDIYLKARSDVVANGNPLNRMIYDAANDLMKLNPDTDPSAQKKAQAASMNADTKRINDRLAEMKNDPSVTKAEIQTQLDRLREQERKVKAARDESDAELENLKKSGRTGVPTNQKDLDQLKTDSEGVVDAIKKKLTELKDVQIQNTTELLSKLAEVDQMTKTNAQTGQTWIMGSIAGNKDLILSYDELILKVKQLQDLGKGVKAPDIGEPQRKAYGGPIGYDNEPIWARGDEFVMNGAATRQFHSQITAMNSTARVPKYFSNGGSVSNDTYNITVQESATPMQTAKQVQQMLSRSKRVSNG